MVQIPQNCWGGERQKKKKKKRRNSPGSPTGEEKTSLFSSATLTKGERSTSKKQHISFKNNFLPLRQDPIIRWTSSLQTNRIPDHSRGTFGITSINYENQSRFFQLRTPSGGWTASVPVPLRRSVAVAVALCRSAFYALRKIITVSLAVYVVTKSCIEKTHGFAWGSSAGCEQILRSGRDLYNLI